MTAILVRCRSCGREVNSAECDRALRCVACVALGLISLDLQRYGEQWRKRCRYRAAGAPLAAINEQLARLAARMSARLHERIADPEQAAALLNRELEQARQRAELAAHRVLVST